MTGSEIVAPTPSATGLHPFTSNAREFDEHSVFGLSYDWGSNATSNNEVDLIAVAGKTTDAASSRITGTATARSRSESAPTRDAGPRAPITWTSSGAWEGLASVEQQPHQPSAGGSRTIPRADGDHAHAPERLVLVAWANRTTTTESCRETKARHDQRSQFQPRRIGPADPENSGSGWRALR